MIELTREQVELARDRIRGWEKPDREWLVGLTEEEARFIVFATAELDLRPHEPVGGAIEIDWRGVEW